LQDERLAVFPLSQVFIGAHLTSNLKNILTMSLITRRTIGRRLGSVNSINSAFQPRTSVAFLLPRFVTNAAATSNGPAANSKTEKILSSGLKDSPELIIDEGLGPEKINWSKSFHGLSVEPFSKETADVLLAPLDPEDVEVKPGIQLLGL
jgi:hypothetical protein